MNRLLTAWTLVSLVLAAVFVGCGQKTDAKTELEKAASTLATADAAPAPPTTLSQSPPPTLQPAFSAEPAAAPASTAAQQMQQALTAYKAGELEDAVTRLQKLRAMPTLTPQQRMAVQDGVAAVMTEIYGLAAKGDSRAIQAVKQYEQMQTMRH